MRPNTDSRAPQGETLESEIKTFANSLPYWAKFLAEKILSGKNIQSKDLDQAYTYLLEELQLIPMTDRVNLDLQVHDGNINYEPDLFFKKLENVEGVNALVEGQILEFNPNLTIIYGSNGSGKSSYTRLMKKAFYSKAQEDILPNIRNTSSHNPTSATFTFATSDGELKLQFPQNKEEKCFSQFSVFDGKCVLKHLDQKNQFEFRPAGLNFFSQFVELSKQLESRLNSNIQDKSGANIFSDLFEGNSIIKKLINSLSANTNLDELKAQLPFTDYDINKKNKVEKEYDDLLLIIKGKEGEVKKLEMVRNLLTKNQEDINSLNKFFNQEVLLKVKNLIIDFHDKKRLIQDDGISNFSSEKIQGIGSTEWKQFIIAAEKFALLQDSVNSVYPNENDSCLLCHQPLSMEGKNLILRYWEFIKSAAEQDYKKSLDLIEKAQQAFEKLNFNLFPIDHTLTIWFSEKYPETFADINKSLESQQEICGNIISALRDKKLEIPNVYQVNTEEYHKILQFINSSIQDFHNDVHLDDLNTLLKEKTLLSHREKLDKRFDQISNFVDNQIWIKKAERVSWLKRNITETEKSLSRKYFNEQYINAFNKECSVLNGDFGISITQTGSSGTSYRQLNLNGNIPSAILSEGEQKVIALSDFLAEMQVSTVNKGIIFDDPVNSLDEKRKITIAERIALESKNRQVIVFTHDLVFVSALITYCEDGKLPFMCHWIENRDDKPGLIWLNNSPSYEKEYRNAEIPKKNYASAKKADCPPMEREFYIKTGFTALRTCYEVLVINDLFKNVVQRFNERVSVHSISSVSFDKALVDELSDSFGRCCRFMEGHSHSDLYAYEKPELINLNEEIQRYETIKGKIKKF